MASTVLTYIREVTDKPVKFVLLSHYHAVRVLGAAAYDPQDIIASRPTYEMIVERGQEDYDSEAGRFPRLFEGIETIPGLTWPTIVFDGKLTVDLGNRKVEIWNPGRGHTQGDTVAWLPDDRILFAGDLVEYGATPYAGDAHFADWPKTLRALKALEPKKLVPGRGEALDTPALCVKAIDETATFVEELYGSVKATRAAGGSLKQAYDAARAALDPKYGGWVIYEHCMPFDVSRAYDEAGGMERPQIWTAARDREMWDALN